MTGRHGLRWTERDDAILRREIVRLSSCALGELLGRSPGGVRCRVSALGLPLSYDSDRPSSGSRWLPVEDDYLRQHLGSLSRGDIASALGRTEAGVRERARTLGILPPRPPPKPPRISTRQIMPASERARIRAEVNARYLAVGQRELARQLGVSNGVIANHARQLGLKIRERGFPHDLRDCGRSHGGSAPGAGDDRAAGAGCHGIACARPGER